MTDMTVAQWNALTPEEQDEMLMEADGEAIQQLEAVIRQAAIERHAGWMTSTPAVIVGIALLFGLMMLVGLAL